MALTVHPPSMIGPAIGPRIRRLVRYGSVSAISTATSLTLLGLLVLFGWPAVVAHVVATAVGTVPSFELNRRWVWRRGAGQSRSFRRQILPYCLLSLVGLVLSSVAVHVAADATATSSRLLHTVAVESANIGTYGALWLIQFVVCDRILFAPSSDSYDPGDAHNPGDSHSAGPGGSRLGVGRRVHRGTGHRSDLAEKGQGRSTDAVD
jgi:putative flippase GtrA